MAFAEGALAGEAALFDFPPRTGYLPLLIVSAGKSATLVADGALDGDEAAWALAESMLAGDEDTAGPADTVWTGLDDACGAAVGVVPRAFSAASNPPASKTSAVIAAPMTNLRRGDITPAAVTEPVALVTVGTPDNSFDVTPVRVT